MIVTIKPEFLNPSDSPDTRYKVVEDNGDRLIISPVEFVGTITPTELVRRHMVVIVEGGAKS